MTEMNNAFEGLAVGWKKLRKESLNLKLCQQKFPKLKFKVKKKNIQELWAIKKLQHIQNENLRRKRNRKRENLEVRITVLMIHTNPQIQYTQKTMSIYYISMIITLQRETERREKEYLKKSKLKWVLTFKRIRIRIT